MKCCVENPLDASKTLFLLIDPTHNFKNIYNLFQRREKFIIPETPLLHLTVADFKHIKELYALESKLNLRMAHKLNFTMLAPSNIQRTSVQLAAALFCESTYNALRFYAENDSSKTNWLQTAKFIKCIHDLWSIVNVKTSSIGQRKRNNLPSPISRVSHASLMLLRVYEHLFKEWKKSSS